MNALTMAYGLTRTEFIPKVRFTFSLPKPRHFYSFFFSLSSRYDFNSHFPSHRNFLYKLHPSHSTQPPIFNFLFITTDPENRFSTPWLANSHGRKEKKTFTPPIGHPFSLPAIRFWRETLSNPSRIPPPLFRWTNFHRRVTRRLTVRNTVFLFIFLFFSAAKFNPKPADWCVELYLSRGAAAV